MLFINQTTGSAPRTKLELDRGRSKLRSESEMGYERKTD